MSYNTICHIEWWVPDFEKAKAFYGALFGWTFQSMGDMYVVFRTPEGGPGGGFSNHEGGRPGGSPIVYVMVEEIEDYTKKIAGLGGRIAMPKTEIPNIGWSAIFEDPFGNSVGLFQSGMPDG